MPPARNQRFGRFSAAGRVSDGLLQKAATLVEAFAVPRPASGRLWCDVKQQRA